jgi:hypothetical protein
MNTGCYAHSTVETEELAAYACGQEHLRGRNAHQVEATGNGKLLLI